MNNNIVNIPTSEIAGISFVKTNSNDIIKSSSDTVVMSTLSFTNLQEIGGANSIRMGSIEHDAICATCKQTGPHCPGHHGYIDLPDMIYDPAYLSFIMDILRSICHKCGNILVEEERKIDKIKKAEPFKRMSEVIRLVKADKSSLVCPNQECRAPLREYVNEAYAIYYRTKKPVDKESSGSKGHGRGRGRGKGSSRSDERILDDRSKHYLFARKIHEIFGRIKPSAMELLGLRGDGINKRGSKNETIFHPCNLLLSAIPVEPLPARPYSRVGTDKGRKEHIVFISIKRIKEDVDKWAKFANKEMTENNDDFIQYISQLNNILYRFHKMSDAQAADKMSEHFKTKIETDTGNQPVKDIKSRMSGKEGRIRLNMFGKRLNYESRTVIDGIILQERIGLLVIPEYTAKNLYYKERVNTYNLFEMAQYVRNGKHVYPGADSVIDIDGSEIDINSGSLPDDKYKRDQLARRIRPGMYVFRHLKNGDITLFGRDPMLHKYSIQAFVIRVVPGMDVKTLRLCVPVLKPFGADFDGDEMTMHLPQSEMSRVEVEELMGVDKNIISMKDSKPQMTALYDIIYSLHTLSITEKKFSKQDFTRLTSSCSAIYGQKPWPAHDEKGESKKVEVSGGSKVEVPDDYDGDKFKPIFSGLDILSYALPEGIGYNDNGVEIKNSRFIKGKLQKDVTFRPLLLFISMTKGPKAADKFLSAMHRIACNWLDMHGNSFGPVDFMLSEEMREDLEKIKTTTLAKCYKDIKDVDEGKLSVPMEMTKKKFLTERHSMIIFQSMQETIKKITDDLNNKSKKLGEKNNLMTMLASESGKRSLITDLNSITGWLGIQTIKGDFIPETYNHRGFPSSAMFDSSLIAKGVVLDNFLYGLNMVSSWMQSCVGKAGMAEKSCGTANTGYVQRKLYAFMESMISDEIGNVRYCGDFIESFVYGCDGLSGDKLRYISFKNATLTDEEMEEKYMMKKK